MSSPTFAAQLVGWMLPAPQIEGLTASARVAENGGVIELEALDEAGEPLNFLYAHAALVRPDLDVTESELTQVGPGRYQTEVAFRSPARIWCGWASTRAITHWGRNILGLVVPYSPEYRCLRNGSAVFRRS